MVESFDIQGVRWPLMVVYPYIFCTKEQVLRTILNNYSIYSRWFSSLFLNDVLGLTPKIRQ